jgi:hypothetical protein
MAIKVNGLPSEAQKHMWFKTSMEQNIDGTRMIIKNHGS